jgi:hypothetical protein
MQSLLFNLLGLTIFSLVFLQVKHLLIDWIWQPEYEWKNKGTFLHFGGIRHAGKNAIGTGLVLGFFWGWISVPLAVLDFVIHYLIDLCKMKTNRHFALCPTKHPQFWWLTGLDQFLHQITYLGLVFLAGYFYIYAK